MRPKELSLRAAKAAWQSVTPAAIGDAVLCTAGKRIPTTSLRTGLGMTRDAPPSPAFHFHLSIVNCTLSIYAVRQFIKKRADIIRPPFPGYEKKREERREKVAAEPTD